MNTVIRMAIWAAALAISMGATAAETDQFYLRSEPMADSTEVLNAKFNQRLSNVVARYEHIHDESVIVHKIFDNLGGYRMKDKYEAWVLESPTVIKREVAMGDSVYAGMPIWSTRVVPIFGLGVTLRVDDQLTLAAGTHVSEDVIIKVAKAVHENKPMLAKAHATFRAFNPKRMGKKFAVLGYHAAAEKFLRQKGLWPKP